MPERLISPDQIWMAKALHLAEQSSLSQTGPNPRVACILVKNGQRIASAVHEKFGGLHAEALALSKAGPKARGATAYVTLEPCCHSDKKTPPCAQALIQGGIRRVVLGCIDQNPKVLGKSASLLKKSGLSVTIGVLKTRAEILNRFFFYWIRTKKPWVILKMASTLDGKITSSNRWLSNPKALERVQQIRKETDAILVGKNTVFADNPRLTRRNQNRAWPKSEQPLRIILDSNLSLKPSFRVFHNGPVLIIGTSKASAARRTALKKARLPFWIAPSDQSGNMNLKAVLSELGRRGIRSVLVEGGSQVSQSFLEQGLVNEAYFNVVPLLAGPQQASLYHGCKIRFKKATIQTLDDNALFHVQLKKR